MRTKTFFVVLFLVLLITACGRVPLLTTEAQENQLGEEAYAQVLQNESPSRDPHLTEVINRVGSRIATATGKSSYQWEFRLLNSSEKNAFCLPGGKVAVYSGILPIAQTEGGLAVILGHEVAHATERHAGQRITLQLGTALGIEALNLLIGGPDGPRKSLLLAALGLGSQVGIQLPFSREMEADADKVGLTFTARAGYDPSEAPKLWQRMAQNNGGAPPVFLSDHPSDASREKALRDELPKVMPDYEKSPRYGLGGAL